MSFAVGDIVAFREGFEVRVLALSKFTGGYQYHEAEITKIPPDSTGYRVGQRGVWYLGGCSVVVSATSTNQSVAVGEAPCKYRIATLINQTDNMPPKPKAHPDDTKLTEQAKAALKSWVCANHREWPTCRNTGKHVSLEYDFKSDSQIGSYLYGYFKCRDCK